MIPWFIGVAIKATVLLLVVAAASVAARRTPAATRHFLWLSGIAALLAMPALALLTPAWSPAWVAGLLPAALAPDGSDSLPAGSASPDSQAPYPVTAFGAFSAAALDGSVAMRVPGTSGGADLVAGERSGRPDGSSFGSPLGLSKSRELSPSLALALVWGSGGFVLFGWLAVGFARRRRLARDATMVHAGPLLGASDRAARSLGIGRRVRLLLGDSRVVPMTWGIVRPVLLLPGAAEGWSRRRLSIVLLHELAHVKRHDSLSRSLGQLACGLFWFHPLAWLCSGRMLREQERACDDIVILAGANPHDYAETLVAIAREFRTPRPGVVGALAFARRSNLEHRLCSILDPLKRRTTLTPFRKVFVLALFAGLALPLAALHPVSAQQPTPVAQSSARSDQRLQDTAAAKAQAAPAPQVGAVVPRASAPVAKSGVVVPRASAPVAKSGVVVPRASAPVAKSGVVVPRASAPVAKSGVVVPRASAPVAERVVVVPPASAPAPQVGNASPQSQLAPRPATVSRRIQLEAEGAIRIGRRLTEAELADGGWLVLSEEGWRLEVRQTASGDRDVVFSIDGALADFDDEARRWADGIFESLAEMGDLRGNVFISTSRDSLSGVYGPLIPGEPLELAMESLGLAMEPLELTMEPLELTMEPLELAIEALDLTMEPLELRMESLDLGLESLDLNMEPLELGMESLDMTLEPLELGMESLALEMEPLELEMESLGLAMEPLELALGSLELGMEPLELVGGLSLADDGRGRRFDRLFTWSQDGSRFVAMWRGSVEIGRSVDEIDAGANGDLVIDESSADGVHRRLHVFAGDSGATTFVWLIDGEATAFDAAGRAWLQPILDWLHENGGQEQPPAS